MCCVRLERCRSTARVAAEVATRVLPKGRWMLICMLRRVLDNWVLGAADATRLL